MARKRTLYVQKVNYTIIQCNHKLLKITWSSGHGIVMLKEGRVLGKGQKIICELSHSFCVSLEDYHKTNVP